MQEFQEPKKSTSSPKAKFSSPRSGGTELLEAEYSFIGKTIGERYQIEKPLGSGGMGVVYRAQDTSLQRKVAIKILRRDLLSSTASQQRFKREGETLARLDHENIVKVHEFGVYDKLYPYIVMEYAPGVSLSKVLEKQERLSIPRTMELALQLCSALNEAHHQGVVHRDLSPANIILVENDWGKQTVKIVDFGIAKIASESQLKLTGSDEIVGSPLYMSPEQCAGSNVDRRADLYSVGCILYECLTAVPPFSASSPLSLMMKHQQEMPLTLHQAAIEGDFPDQLELIVARLMEKSPEARYQYADEVKLELEVFCASQVYEAICKGWPRDLWPESSATGLRRAEPRKTPIDGLAFDLQLEREKLHGEIYDLMGTRTAFQIAAALCVVSVCVFVCCSTLLFPIVHPTNPKPDATESQVYASKFSQVAHYAPLKVVLQKSKGSSLNASDCFTVDNWKELLKTRTFTQIDLSETDVTDLALSYLDEPLRDLRLYDCRKLTGAGFKYLARIKSLRSLDLSANPDIGDSSLRFIGGNLHRLALNRTAVSDKGVAYVARLTNLRHLELRYLQITDAALTSLMPLKLEYLDLTCCPKLSDEKIRAFLLAHPDCVVKRLHVSGEDN